MLWQDWETGKVPRGNRVAARDLAGSLRTETGCGAAQGGAANGSAPAPAAPFGSSAQYWPSDPRTRALRMPTSNTSTPSPR